MNFRLNSAVALVLAASLVGANAYAGDPPAPAKKKQTAKKPAAPSVQDQIQALRQEMQSQIDGLKNDLANKDAQLKQAQQAASDAQASAARAQEAATAQQQVVTENASAVSTLQSTVTDLKANAVSLATTVSDETANIKKAINSPNELHYKGVTLTPGGYLAAETVWRSRATGGDIPTAFNALPYEHADAYSLSEFYGSARQSRIALMVEGKPTWGTLRGYYEADFLGTGVTSNDNQSNSYVLRQRVLWAQAETHSHWAFTGGQLWSLATEDKKAISNLSGDIMTPQTIDPNYNVGFVWERQYGFRVTKTGKWAAFGVALENPQVLYTATLAGNTPYAVLGSAGNNGGAYNAAISAVAPTTYVQNYTQVSGSTSYIPVYNTIAATSNIANYSFNHSPDYIVKVALDPKKWGHYEIIGIARVAHEEIYPGVTTDSTKYGGQKDIETGANVVAASTTAGAYNNKIAMGGMAASMRVPLANNKVSFGFKGMWGPGLGRYGDSGLADLTTNNYGGLSPIHNGSALFTLELTPTPRWLWYFNYGGEYASRVDWSGAGTTTLGSPTATFCPTGFTSATQCTAKPTAAQLAAGGTWGGHWSAPALAAVGYGSRLTSNSGCLVNTVPGYNGTGFFPGGSCGDQTRDVQEITGGYWYDIYRGEHGRFRQSFQYSYAARYGWSGVGGIQAKGINNMFWTSLRYYLP
jgi:hypothetical protein